jgi:glycosyltransferase involved in cell wall biosynthesis
VSASKSEPHLSDVDVLAATLMPLTGPTGVQTHLQEACAFLAARGSRPEVITPHSWGGSLAIPVFGARLAIDRLSGPGSIAWYRYWHYVFLKRALKRRLRGASTTVVYAQCALAAKAALEARSGENQKVVVAIHSDGSQADEWVDKKMLKVGSLVYRSITELEQSVLPTLDGIVYVSEAARASMARHVQGLDRIRSATVRSFIAMPSPHETVMPAEKRDLVTVGGLEIAKNHGYLLRVLAAANARGCRYTLDLVGDGPCRRSLEALTRSLGLEGQVRFLGSRTAVRDLLPRYRAYVHTSIRESLCVAIVEAMACGLPVVAGPVGGIPELFTPGEEGLFWSLEDQDQAARVLCDLMEDEPAIDRLGTAARARFDKFFEASVVGPALEKLLISTLRPGSEKVEDDRQPV